MPQHRNEPPIYTGKIYMMMGEHVGQLVPLEYKVAQGLVQNGQARWEQDVATQPLPRQFRTDLERQEAEREEQIAKDAAHNAAMKAAAAGQQLEPKQDVATITDVGVIRVASEDYGEGAHDYLAKPFPNRVEIAPEMIGTSPNGGVIARSDDAIAIRLANGTADFKVIAEDEQFIYAGLVSAEEPDVEIPVGWRDRHHMQIVAMAKKLRGLDNSVSMTKDAAIAIIEEWTTPDDQVREVAVGPAGGEKGEARTGDGKRILDGNQAPKTQVGEDGQEIQAKTAEEIAAEEERKLLDDGFDGE